MTSNMPVGLILIVFAPVAAAESGGPAADQPELPETPQGRAVADYLRVFNSGDEKAMAHFVTRHWAESAVKRRTPEERNQIYRQLYGDTRGLELRRVEETTDTLVSVLCQAKLTEQWLTLGFEFEPDPPHGVTGVRFMMTGPPADEQPKGAITEAEMRTAIEAHLNKLTDADAFSGAVLVAKDGKPIFSRVCGQASRRFNVPNRLDTKFNLGSCNKMFTAVAIAQLAEQGKLSFDDPVIKHLPDYPNPELARKVTIHHLLTHTSGMGDYFDALFAAKWPQLRKLADFLPLFTADSLEFEAGDRMRYSNAGFIVLGLIIEKLSGENYHDYVKKHIFEPAGMTSTDSYEMDDPVANLAIGYTRMGPDGEPAPADAPRRENYFMHAVKGMSAGGGYSTVEDLLKFAVAFQAHKLLSREMTERVTAGKVEMGPEMRYAYGFGDRRQGGLHSVGHNGGAPGISASFRMYPEAGFTICVLSNYDPPAAERVADKIEEFITRVAAYGRFSAPSPPLDPSIRVTDLITTGSTGTTFPIGSFGSVFTSVSLILSTTSMPSTTLPKTQ